MTPRPHGSEEDARCEAILPVFGLVERCVLDVGHDGYHRSRGGEEFTVGAGNVAEVVGPGVAPRKVRK